GEALAEGPCDLVADLVAARADPRTDHGDELPSAELGRGRLDDPGKQAAPAHVQRRDRGPLAVRPRKRDRQAVGGEDEERPPRLVGPDAVARLPLAGCTTDRCPVDLAAVTEELR